MNAKTQKKEDHNVSGDNDSIKLFMMLMIAYDNFEGVVKGHKGCGYDVKGLKNGCNYLFNLKQRDFNSTKYGDLVMDKADFEALEWAKKQSGENTKILYAQFFKDNTLFITNDQGWSVLKRSCPTTTRFEQNNYIEKTLMQKMQDADNVRRIDLNDRHLGDFIKYLYEPKPKTEKKTALF